MLGYKIIHIPLPNSLSFWRDRPCQANQALLFGSIDDEVKRVIIENERDQTP